MLFSSILETICNICVAVGGIGTVGTLVYMIIDSRKRAKQIDTVQMIQSHQLEALYEPDIRLVSWTDTTTDGSKSEIVIDNHGNHLKLTSIQDLSQSGLLNVEGAKGWFPYDFDSGEQIHIPLDIQLRDAKGSNDVGIICYNKLGLTYLVRIRIVDGKPYVERPVKQ